MGNRGFLNQKLGKRMSRKMAQAKRRLKSSRPAQAGPAASRKDLGSPQLPKPNGKKRW
jgi:hypothetical protein